MYARGDCSYGWRIEDISRRGKNVIESGSGDWLVHSPIYGRGINISRMVRNDAKERERNKEMPICGGEERISIATYIKKKMAWLFH